MPQRAAPRTCVQELATVRIRGRKETAGDRNSVRSARERLQQGFARRPRLLDDQPFPQNGLDSGDVPSSPRSPKSVEGGLPTCRRAARPAQRSATGRSMQEAKRFERYMCCVIFRKLQWPTGATATRRFLFRVPICSRFRSKRVWRSGREAADEAQGFFSSRDFARALRLSRNLAAKGCCGKRARKASISASASLPRPRLSRSL